MKKLDSETVKYILKQFQKVRDEVNPKWDWKGQTAYICDGDNKVIQKLKREVK